MCQRTALEIQKSVTSNDNGISTSDYTSTSTSGSETELDENTNSPTNTRIPNNASCIKQYLSSSQSSSITNKAIYTILWFILTYTSKEFAKFLSIHQSKAAQKTFIPASYIYDKTNTFFDNTFLTYGTDYMIFILMIYASYKCYSTRTGLGYKGSALFGSYATSVFCGGWAHSHFYDVDSLNTMEFRIWWIVCVGTVTAAGGFMGMCGTELCTFFMKGKYEERFSVGGAYVPHLLWWFYGGFLTFVCVMGEISYKRPACDIFVAGTTQFVPTVYVELMLLSMKWKDAIPFVEGVTCSAAPISLTPSTPTVAAAATTTTNEYAYLNISRKLRLFFYIGFFSNAPLLPSYPMLVQYTNLSLGVVNALLHTNLTFAWGMQAWSIYHISLAMKESKLQEEGVGEQEKQYPDPVVGHDKKSL